MQGLWQTAPSILAKLRGLSQFYLYPISCPKGPEQDLPTFLLNLEQGIEQD